MSWEPDPDEDFSTVTLGVGLKSAPSSSTGRASTIADRPQSMEEDAVLDSESNEKNSLQGWSKIRAKVLDDIVNWGAMRKLFAVCRNGHQHCHSSGFDTPIDFRLIDVKERFLVRSNGPVEFCALSYVWGRRENSEPKETEMLTNESLERMERPGFFTESALPNTIEDAIQACSALGFRYLWVDRLCIVQDDERSKNHQIHAMGDIFASAELVLIASSSENMHAGISGVRHSRQTEQWRLSSSDLDLVRLPRLDEMIEGCQWRTRAWTYQEAVLPRRKLWLTGTQAYFQCCEGTFSEDTIHVSDDPDDDSTYTMDWTRSKLPIQQYFAHLGVYSGRSLTFQSDIYNAFIGIANKVYEADVLAYGLPRPDFDQALLWSLCYVQINGRDAESITLPSWSWASIEDRITTAGSDLFSFCGTLVQWTVCVEFDGQLSLERINADNAPFSWIEQRNRSIYHNWESIIAYETNHGLSPQLYMAFAWSQGCIGAPQPSGFCSFKNHTFDEMSVMAHALWPTYNEFYRNLDLGKDQSTLDTTVFPSTCIPGSLIGRVQTAILEIPICNEDQGELAHKDRQIGIMDFSTSSWRQGSTVKAIAISVFNRACPESNNNYHLQYFSSRYPSILKKDPSTEETKRIVAAGEEILRDPNENLTFFDCNGEALLPPPMLNLMIIEEEGPLYRRIGMGWAYLARWVQVDRKFETVTLV